MSNPRNEHTEDPYVTGNLSKDAAARASDPNYGAETFQYEEPNRNISVYDYRMQQQLMEERLK